MRSTNIIWPLIATTALLSGCVINETDGNGGSGGTGGSDCHTGGGGSGGEDTCYQGTMDMGAEAADWAIPNEEDSYTVTAPADPGGGLYRFKLTVNHPDAVPWLEIHNKNTPDGAAMLGGSAATTANEQEWNGVFVAWPGQTYDVKVFEFVNAPTDAHPVNYSLSWTFEPLVDCYEPNDTLAEAALVKRGQTVEAYLVAGYETDSLGSILDHYAVQVDEPTTLTFTLVGQPQNTSIDVRAFRPDTSFPDGYAQMSGGGELANGDSYDWQASEPGLYVFEISDSGLAMKAEQDDPDPPHLGATYQFRID
ncbi:MAG: hypothetical protein KC731_19620 [Myxococcales bacterium]|nr:hypothetical protein [Myxococcales bacterium]